MKEKETDQIEETIKTPESNKVDNKIISDLEQQEKDNNNINIFGLIEERRKNNKKNVYRSQSYISIKKNILIFKRHYKTTILLFSTPLIIAAIILFLQWCLDTWSNQFTNINPETKYLEDIDKCPSPSDCLTIMTIIIDKSNNTENREEATKIMNYVAENNKKLKMGKDIIISDTLTNYTQFSNYLDKHKNKTYYGVIFCYDYLDTEFYSTKVNIPCKPQFQKPGEEYRFYTIVYNVTNCPNDFLEMPYEPRNKDVKLTKLKIDIDNAYLEIFHEKYGENKTQPAPKINVSIADFPQTEMRFFKGTSVVNNFGAPFFMLIPITLFILLFVDIVKEKQYHLRKSLLIIGMTNGSFWTGWIVVAFLFSLIMVIIFLILSLILGWEFFINVPFPIVFVLFYLFYIDLQFLAFFLSTIISNIKTAYATSFLIIVVAAVIQGIFTVPFIYQIIFSEGVSWTVFFFKVFLYLFCPYSFSKAYIEIATIATTKLNEQTLTNTIGREYYYSDLFTKHDGHMLVINTYYNIPPTYQSFIILFLDGLFYLLLAWYFDNVLQANRGKGKSPLFFIYRIGRLFGYCEKKKKLKESDSNKEFDKLNESARNTFFSNNTFRPTISSNIDSIENTNVEEKSSILKQKGYETVLAELSKIKEDEKNEVFLDGLRIVGASKTYNLADGKKLNALENIYFDISRGELLTLLGHNGAGKTTLINALCGNIPITSGYAIINNVNITNENVRSKYKRQLIGLCPQHDILWEELTPMEHIELYAVIRNYDYNDIKEIGKMKMKEVNLEHVMNERVGTFSGGMKRRISILLSTIGNPNVVFLDEPSTGLDPVNRRFIWDMIKEIKKKSSVILTTHSMNEAEYLSDRICIIQKGKMQCIGSSLDLKRIYGEGYILTFICEKNSEEKVKEIIMGLSEGIKLISSKAGSLIFSLPFEKLSELNWFIKILNKDFSDKNLKPLEGIILECGIEQTSIEEIFLKIGKGEEDDDIRDGLKEK